MAKTPCRLIDIRPNHDLLNTNFEGYKLSLDNIATIRKPLPTNVLRSLPKSSQFSLQHVQLLGLHNHLFGETNLDGDCLYYIDISWQVHKININPVYEYHCESSVVFNIPPPATNAIEASFNVSMCLLSYLGIALISDGFGSFYILDTNENYWKVIYSAELVDIGRQFCIKDAKGVVNAIDSSLRKIQCVFLSIKDNCDDKQMSVLHLLTFVERDGNNWSRTIFKELCCKGTIYYNYLDRDSDNALIVISDNHLEFVQDSEYPIEKSAELSKKIYKWSQNELQIILNIPFSTLNSTDIKIDDLEVNFTDGYLSIKFINKLIIEGKLHSRILEEETGVQIKDNAFRIHLNKWDGELMWPEVIIGDQNGEYNISEKYAENVHQQLAHLCTEEEVSNDDNQIFSSEDCDHADPISAPILERLDIGAAHSPTHRVHLNAHGVLLEIQSGNNATDIPSVGLRFDVDALICKFGKTADQTWDVWHDGTLLAFGYVQASKQQRKFTVCPPDLSYVAILESSRHIFLYRQGRALSGGCELRHRHSGRRFVSTAQQQVISIGPGEMLGVYVTNATIYVLTENELVILRIV